MRKRLFAIASILFLWNIYNVQANTSRATFIAPPPENSSVFEDYPWLSTLIDNNNCTTEKVEVYQLGIYPFLLVTDATGTARLYNEDGVFYCENSSTYDCIAAYGFGPPVSSQTWTCGTPSGPAINCLAEEVLISRLRGNVGSSSCFATTKITRIDYNGATYYRSFVGLNPDRDPRILAPCPVQENFGKVVDCRGIEICLFALVGPPPNHDPVICDAVQRGLGTETEVWSITGPPTNQCTNEGQIFFQNCDNGELYYFIRTTDGRVFDPYPASDISYTPQNGESIKFGYINANFGSPCSIAERAITLTCVEVVETPTDLPLFDDYPWLLTLVNPDNCSSGRVEAYLLDNNTYIRVSFLDSRPTQLYNQFGDLLCEDSDNFDCVTVYGLGAPVDSWTCEPTSSGVCSYLATIRFDPCSPELKEVAVYQFRGLQYAVLETFVNGNPQEVSVTVIECETRSILCSNQMPPNNVTSRICSSFFAEAIKTQVVVNKERDCASPPETSFVDAYPFLANILQPGACKGYKAVEVYPENGYDFVYVRRNKNRGLLYLDDGTFYCESTGNYDCLEAYGLTTPSRTWQCSNFDNSASKTRSASSNELDFIVSPNPTAGQLTIQLPPPSSDGYQLYLYDVLGRTMQQETVAPLETFISIDMANYENGIYYIELRAAGVRKIQKVVKRGSE